MAREQMNPNMQEQMLGTGLVPDPNMVDPVSGNEIPLGATAEGVRDDQPAALSAGEFIIPSFAVNFYGVQQLQQLVDSAEMGLKQMEHRGLTGMPDEEPSLGATDRMVEEEPLLEAPIDVEEEPLLEAPIDVEEYYKGGSVKKYANGGLTTAAIPAPRANMVATPQAVPVQQNMASPLRPQRPVRDPSRSVSFPTYEEFQNIKYVKYVNEAGNSILIPFIRGIPQRRIPTGFTPASTADEVAKPTAPVESEEDKAAKLVAAQEEQERQRFEEETALDDEGRREEDERQENLKELSGLEKAIGGTSIDTDTPAAEENLLDINSEAARSLIDGSLDLPDGVPIWSAISPLLGRSMAEGNLAQNADKIWEEQGGQIPGAVKFNVGEGEAPIYIIARKSDTLFGRGPDFQAYQNGKQISIDRVLSTVANEHGVLDLTLDQIVTDEKGNFLRFKEGVDTNQVVGRDDVRRSLRRDKYLGITSDGQIIIRDPEKRDGTRTSRMSKRTFSLLTPEQQVLAAGGIDQKNVGKRKLFGGANIDEKWLANMSADEKAAYDAALAKLSEEVVVEEEAGLPVPDDDGGIVPQPVAPILPSVVPGVSTPYMVDQPVEPQPVSPVPPISPVKVEQLPPPVDPDPRVVPQDFDFTGQSIQPPVAPPVAPAGLPQNLQTFLDNLKEQQAASQPVAPEPVAPPVAGFPAAGSLIPNQNQSLGDWASALNNQQKARQQIPQPPEVSPSTSRQQGVVDMFGNIRDMGGNIVRGATDAWKGFIGDPQPYQPKPPDAGQFPPPIPAFGPLPAAPVLEKAPLLHDFGGIPAAPPLHGSGGVPAGSVVPDVRKSLENMTTVLNTSPELQKAIANNNQAYLKAYIEATQNALGANDAAALQTAIKQQQEAKALDEERLREEEDEEREKADREAEREAEIKEEERRISEVLEHQERGLQRGFVRGGLVRKLSQRPITQKGKGLASRM